MFEPYPQGMEGFLRRHKDQLGRVAGCDTTYKKEHIGRMLWMDTTRLTCVPIDLLNKLVELWNSFLLGHVDWPDTMKLAKIVTPKKKEVTNSMMDVRPITILSLVYRVLSKAWTKKL